MVITIRAFRWRDARVAAIGSFMSGNFPQGSNGMEADLSKMTRLQLGFPRVWFRLRFLRGG